MHSERKAHRLGIIFDGLRKKLSDDKIREDLINFSKQKALEKGIKTEHEFVRRAKKFFGDNLEEIAPSDLPQDYDGVDFFIKLKNGERWMVQVKSSDRAVDEFKRNSKFTDEFNRKIIVVNSSVDVPRPKFYDKLRAELTRVRNIKD